MRTIDQIKAHADACARAGNQVTLWPADVEYLLREREEALNAAHGLSADLTIEGERADFLRSALWHVLVRADALLDSAAEHDTPPWTPVNTDAFDALVTEVEDLKREHPDLWEQPVDPIPCNQLTN